MTGYDLAQEFIVEVPLPKTAAAYPQVGYADDVNLGRELFSRVGWFPSGVRPTAEKYLCLVRWHGRGH